MQLEMINFAWTRRGPSSAILMRDEDGALATGTIFYHEAPGGDFVNSVTTALEYLNDPMNQEQIWKALTDPVQDKQADVHAGWTTSPKVEQQMLERELKKLDWT